MPLHLTSAASPIHNIVSTLEFNCVDPSLLGKPFVDSFDRPTNLDIAFYSNQSLSRFPALMLTCCSPMFNWSTRSMVIA